MANTKHFGTEKHTMAEISGSERRARTGPRPPSDTKRTVTMAALTDLPPELTPRGRADTQSGGGLTDRTMMLNIGDLEMQASSRPMEEVRQPPEINLTEHHLRTDVRHDPRLIMMHDPDSERSACFRILRHHLMDHGRPQVIVVSSAMPGDGKTTCAVNLALALAECGRARVLLVEATVRSPQLARIFELTPPWCFAEQLTAHRQQPLLPWSAVQVPEMFLHIAAMHPNIEQRQLLDAPAFAIAMERLRLGKYDHIVVDAPAVIGSAEVNLLQDAADGVILVARAKKTTARSMRQAVEQLSPTKIIGSVLLQ
ncbi:MAG TPA: CpsD/CapB family tyrosine-protein kinase [Haliangium sp.]|nr:CpsD/CapB family tyrosine-protein kinase [Haliangium sp.]